MLSKEMKRVVKSMVKLSPKRRHPVAAQCDNNAKIRAMLDKFTVDGKIGLIIEGMDCDCTSYYTETVIPAFKSVGSYKRWDDERQEWLDGPESVTFVRPDQITPQHRSRDLAMEAYEDGHPHSIKYERA